jgi:hypothetical protein
MPRQRETERRLPDGEGEWWSSCNVEQPRRPHGGEDGRLTGCTAQQPRRRLKKRGAARSASGEGWGRIEKT